MADPRFGRRQVRARTAHACWWCPDDVAAGATCEVWSVKDHAGKLVMGHAHPVCEQSLCDHLGEAQGDLDDVVRERDRESMPRTLSFMESEADVRKYVCAHHPEEGDRLTAMWARGVAKRAAKASA